MTRSAQGSISTIDQFINSVDSVKTASDGSTPLSEPGSIGGETKHPVKKVDDRLEKAKEGERSSENSKDVKDAVGAPSIENAAEAPTKAASIFDLANKFAAGTKKAEGAVSTPGSAEEDVNQTGTKKAPTGEDSASETNSAKAGKEDPGSKHPARTDNTALDGHKYAADDPLEKLAGDMREIGNQVLTAVHGAYQHNGIQAPAATSHATKQASAAPAIDPRLAAQAGFELAGLVNGTWDKKAADAFVQGKTVEIIKQASDRADLFIHYANNFLKAAEGEEEMPADPSQGAGGGGEPPAPGDEGGGEGDMMAALGGGEGAEAGGDPMAGMGGGGAGGGEDPEAIELAQILSSLGVTPEQLEQAMAQNAAGGAGGGMGGDPMGGGGAPPPGGGDPMAAMGGGGAPPPGGGGAPPPGMEVQAAAGARKNSGTMTAEKKAAVKAYVTEIITRSRR